MKVISCDCAVIGAGHAGIEAYRAASAAGADCVLIDDGSVGNLAQRSGEWPSALLMSAGLAVRGARMSEQPGGDPVKPDTAGVMERVKASLARQNAAVLTFLYTIPEERRLRGHACFYDPNTVIIEAEYEIHFRTAVICTGSAPLVTFEQSRLPGIVSTDQFFSLRELPHSAAVFGSSAVGLQLGQALSYLGAEVTVFGQQQLWELTDESVLSVAKQELSARFHLEFDSFITSLECERAAEFTVYYVSDGRYENYLRTQAVIAAAGRVPNVGRLNLTHIGIKLTRTGSIMVNAETQQTNLRHIFAAGDVVRNRQSSDAARKEGRIAGRNAAAYPEIKPCVGRAGLMLVYTDPGMAIVGRSLEQMKARARATGDEFVTARVRMAGGRYRVGRRDQGIVSVYVDCRTHRICGAEICAPGAEHLGQFLGLVMERGMTAEELRDFGFYHLSGESVLAEAAGEAVSQIARRGTGGGSGN